LILDFSPDGYRERIADFIEMGDKDKARFILNLK
jgi:hypothetical protein